MLLKKYIKKFALNTITMGSIFKNKIYEYKE